MRFIALLLLIVFSSGCSLLRSRYAMDDPVYAEKYALGADKSDILGKAKQAFDARHTGELSGVYISGGAQMKPESGDSFGGAELGSEAYFANWGSGRGSLATYIGPDEGYAGLDAGMRFQTPTRIAPFVGIGTFQGLSRSVELADGDLRDNDDDGFIDEPGEEKSGVDDFLSAVYPEVGGHLWIDGVWRVTAYGRYFVTSEGREHDDWLIGGQITAFRR